MSGEQQTGETPYPTEAGTAPTHENHAAYAAGHGAPATEKRGGPGLAIAALAVGILAFLLSWTVVGGIIGGLIALVLGLVASSKAKKGRASGRAMAVIGWLLGLVSILIGGAVLAAGVAFFQSDSVQNLQDCLTQAGSDQAAIDSCTQEFGNSVSGS
ncbi:DUF4190 domain-containing protein [Nocardioides sp. GY 10127]|uniref:DUF4190 domain-containing protein n=1 Tax=Nocardioides sp. GY 10127 TaxID=2569762 RepID=UPI0010A9391C|nr:DUF4190 domain-containing protein [Nocardioides sp. GY 10127]TIC80164.1 DUF4190 domain-containing protein [Nocardioides sp. GY 10127]